MMRDQLDAKNLLRSLIFSLSLIVISSHGIAFADVASLDSNYVAGQTNMITKLNNDRTTLTNSVNNIRGVYAGSVQTSGQIKADTVGEENMADDANPRIRSNEGASCSDFVYSGMLSSVTSGTLVGSIPAGVAYPDGYRIEKTNSTAKTFTANKWTYVYILTSGSFDYQETSIGAASPSDLSNSALISRVSTDATEVVDVQDLRTTSCTSGPFDIISDATGEANLDDILANGSPVKYGGTDGFIQGLHVAWNDHTTFTVTSGSAYINGKFRITSQDLTVTTGADAPSSGTSGIDSGAIAASTRYNVFAVADQETVKTLSVSYGTGSTPSGVTNYRKIGEIATDASSLFTSGDVYITNGINQFEQVGGYVRFNGSGTVSIDKSYNVSGIADNGGSGTYTVSWNRDFATTNYVAVCSSNRTFADPTKVNACTPETYNVGSVKIRTATLADSAGDSEQITVIAVGERQ